MKQASCKETGTLLFPLTKVQFNGYTVSLQGDGVQEKGRGRPAR